MYAGGLLVNNAQDAVAVLACLCNLTMDEFKGVDDDETARSRYTAGMKQTHSPRIYLNFSYLITFKSYFISSAFVNRYREMTD